MHVKPGVIKPRYATDRVISYIRNVISNQGVYAYHCALYNTGKIAEDTMVQLRAVKKAIRGDDSRTGARRASSGRILFLGNSITLHPPKADIGWTNNVGMAASALEKDYVHLLLKRFTDAAGGKAPEARVENAANFEREYATYPIATKFKELAEFKADTVILCIAENVPQLATQTEQDRFKAAVKELLIFVKGNGSPAIYVRSSLWPDGVKDGILKQVCAELAGPLWISVGWGPSRRTMRGRSASFRTTGWLRIRVMPGWRPSPRRSGAPWQGAFRHRSPQHRRNAAQPEATPGRQACLSAPD